MATRRKRAARAPRARAKAAPRARAGARRPPELPMGFGAPEPELASRVPEEERAERVINDGETCGVDEHYFLKGSLEIPLKGSKQPFVWTVWVALDEEIFERVIDLWQVPARVREEPYPATLATRIPIYPETLHLDVRVHTREVGKRPFIEVVSPTHPLAKEQRAGISVARVRQIAEALSRAS